MIKTRLILISIIIILGIIGIVSAWIPSVGDFCFKVIKETFIIFGILFLIIALPISMIGLIPDDNKRQG